MNAIKDRYTTVASRANLALAMNIIEADLTANESNSTNFKTANY